MRLSKILLLAALTTTLKNMPLPLVLGAPAVVNGVAILVTGVVVADQVNKSLSNPSEGFSDNYAPPQLGGFEPLDLRLRSLPPPPENPVWDGRNTGNPDTVGELKKQVMKDAAKPVDMWANASLRDSYMPLVGAPPLAQPPVIAKPVSQPLVKNGFNSPSKAGNNFGGMGNPYAQGVSRNNYGSTPKAPVNNSPNLGNKLSPQLGSAADLFQKNIATPFSNSIAAVANFNPNFQNFPFFGLPFFGNSDDQGDGVFSGFANGYSEDAGRVDSYPVPNAPPFKGGQSAGVTYKVFVRADYANGGRFVTNGAATFNDLSQFSPTNPYYAFTGPIQGLSVTTNGDGSKTWKIGNQTPTQNTFGRIGFGTTYPPDSVYVVKIERADGQMDMGGDPPPLIANQAPSAPPIYPPANEWSYGDVLVKVGGVSDAPNMGNTPFTGLNSPVAPMPNPELPSVEPTPSPAIAKSANGFPSVENAKLPSGVNTAKKAFADFPKVENNSFAVPSFQAKPFEAGKSAPSEQYDPIDVNTGLTRSQFQEKLQERVNENINKAAVFDAKENEKIFLQLSTKALPELDGKSPQQVARERYLATIANDPIRNNAYNSVATPISGINTTPQTQTQTQQIVTTVTQITQNLDQIKVKLKEAICEQSAPNGCIDNSIKRNKEENQNQNPETVSITVREFTACNGENPQFSDRVITVLKGTEEAVQGIYQQLADIEALQCKPIEAYAAVPEWWQIRPEGKRPQLVLQFCAKGDDGKYGAPKYSLTIPHPKLTTKVLSAPLPEYEKGNFEIQLRLKDNSHVIVNCSSKEEGERVLSILKGLISRDMLKDSYIKYSERNGRPVKTQKMAARFVTYFEKGIEDASKYKWKARFDLPKK